MSWAPKGQAVDGSGWVISFPLSFGLKRVFQILLNHRSLEVLGTVNVVVDEVCGEGTWAKYTIRCQRWTEGREEKEAIALEKARKELEGRWGKC